MEKMPRQRSLLLMYKLYKMVLKIHIGVQMQSIKSNDPNLDIAVLRGRERISMHVLQKRHGICY